MKMLVPTTLHFLGTEFDILTGQKPKRKFSKRCDNQNNDFQNYTFTLFKYYTSRYVCIIVIPGPDLLPLNCVQCSGLKFWGKKPSYFELDFYSPI